MYRLNISQIPPIRSEPSMICMLAPASDNSWAARMPAIPAPSVLTLSNLSIKRKIHYRNILYYICNILLLYALLWNKKYTCGTDWHVFPDEYLHNLIYVYKIKHVFFTRVMMKIQFTVSIQTTHLTVVVCRWGYSIPGFLLHFHYRHLWSDPRKPQRRWYQWPRERTFPVKPTCTFVYKKYFCHLTLRWPQN